MADNDRNVQGSGRVLFILVDKMRTGPLKRKAEQCAGSVRKNGFFDRPPGRRHSLQFPPEHTRGQNAMKGRRTHGAPGIQECGTWTFTRTGKLVCRHDSAICTHDNILGGPPWRTGVPSRSPRAEFRARRQKLVKGATGRCAGTSEP